MQSHEFSIPVASLDAAGRSFRFPVRAAWIRGALAEHDRASSAGPRLEAVTTSGTDGELDVRLSKSGNDVVVHGRVAADLVAPCARCLEPVTIRIDEAVIALMVPAAQIKRPGSGEYEFSSDEADVLPYDGETVVLDDLVRDGLVLEIPMIPLCREDCPGMSHAEKAAPAAKAGEKPIDPRLLPLARLKQTYADADKNKDKE
jgi:uncharacterized protein